MILVWKKMILQNNDSTCHLSSRYRWRWVLLRWFLPKESSPCRIIIPGERSKTPSAARLDRIFFCFPSGGGVYTVQTRRDHSLFNVIHTSNTANKSMKVFLSTCFFRKKSVEIPQAAEIWTELQKPTVFWGLLAVTPMDYPSVSNCFSAPVCKVHPFGLGGSTNLTKKNTKRRLNHHKITSLFFCCCFFKWIHS